MTDAPILTFDPTNKLGMVASVDTSRVLIAVENASLLPRAAVGSLIAIQGTTAQEFLIGTTERVTRHPTARSAFRGAQDFGPRAAQQLVQSHRLSRFAAQPV